MQGFLTCIFGQRKVPLLHAKSLNTDKAWEVYDYLVDFCFRVREEKKEIICMGTKKFVPIFINMYLTFWVHHNIFVVYSKSEVRNMSPRTGRPKSDNPKSEQIKIRATKQDKTLLEKCCKITGKTQYEVVMDGIKKVYAENEK